MIFSIKRIQTNHPPIFFNGTPVMRFEEQKHLGAILDSKLSFTSHIQSVISKCRQEIVMLRFLSKYLSRHTLNEMYKLYVRPHLDYGEIGKKHIKRVRFVKFLRLLLDEHLSWKYHLSELSKQLARTCGIFFKIRNLLPLDVLLCLYNALFLSFLQYGLIVWGQTFTSYVDLIFKLQKKAVRAISFQPRMSPSLPIFKDLKLLTLSELFELRLLTFVFDSVNKTSSSCFHDFFLLNSCVHHYSTRQASQDDLYLFRRNSLQYGLKSIRYLGAKLWNTLPIELQILHLKHLSK